ncbi:MAG: hypothetical protein H7A47_15420 [Verrucomicrobiales bacterium]|nr:hypothetical protein [Verrucomicrobiales bacterium]
MITTTTVPKANLIYYIYEGVLSGNAGGRHFQLFAASGGGGGSTKHEPSTSANNPYMTGLRTRGKGARHRHGGPLPLGRYKIHRPAKHPHLGRSAFLEPFQGIPMLGRSGFFIHGRGPHGSDGCIVPLAQFKALMDALESSDGGTLHVLEATGGTRFA